jgi:hypothetical protein
MPTNMKMVDDPEVKLPKAVREASARADALFQQYRDPRLDENGQPLPDEVTPPELDPASLAADNEEDEGGGNEQPAPQPEPPEPPQGEDDGTWEHKYKSMHGRYVALQDQYRGLSDQVSNLQNLLATMQHAPNGAPAAPIVTERLVTEQEETDYGKDLLTVVGKRAKEELAPLLSAQAQQIEKLNETVRSMAGQGAQRTQQSLLERLDTRMPEWRDVNTNPEFLSWLRLPDAYSGAIRHDMLKAAYAAGDATRVLAFFNGFLAEEAATTPAQAEPDPSMDERKVVPRIPLRNLAAPGKAKNAASSQGAPVEKPIITRAQIATFYSDVAAGRYRGRDDEKASLEAQIFAAQASGRIR